MKKISEDSIRKYLYEHGGWTLVSSYNGTHNPIIIEKDGYKATTCFTSFRKNNNAIIFGSKNPYYKSNIELMLKRKDDSVIFVDARGEVKSGKHRIIIEMIDSKGHHFIKTLEHVLCDNERLCCKLCSRQEQTYQHRKEFTKKWLHRINSDKYKILHKPEFITADSVLDIEEIETGYKFEANIRSIVKGTLQAFNIFSNRKYFLYNLVVYGNKNALLSVPIEIGDVKSSHNKVVFKCKCGNKFERSIYKWMDGHDLCRNCNNIQSSYERRFEDYLIKNNFNYKREYRFNDCKDVKPLPFDFYLKDFDCLIEIDGLQHFEPVRFGGYNESPAKRFELQQKHDKIKNDYCNKKNIPLLRISYISFKNGNWIEIFNHFIETVKD